MTLARCVCKLFLASPVSDMRLVKATLTLLNWFHISLEVAFSRISISSLSLWEAARSLWECRMLSSVNLDHESGREILTEKQMHLQYVPTLPLVLNMMHWEKSFSDITKLFSYFSQISLLLFLNF